MAKENIEIPINLGKHIEENIEDIKDNFDSTDSNEILYEGAPEIDLKDKHIEDTKNKSNNFFKSKREKLIFFAFIIPPFAISIISMIHMVSLFEAVNSYFMAISIAIAIELAAISSLVALVTLDKLNKTTIWSIFGVLALLQIVANMYHAYINRTKDPEFLSNILKLLAIENTDWSIRLVMFLISGILPVIALAFVKGIVEYFKE